MLNNKQNIMYCRLFQPGNYGDDAKLDGRLRSENLLEFMFKFMIRLKLVMIFS